MRNGLNETIYVVAFEKNILALINWAPVSTEENKIEPQKSRMIDKDDILGYEEGTVVVVFYWNLEMDFFENIEVQ